MKDNIHNKISFNKRQIRALAFLLGLLICSYIYNLFCKPALINAEPSYSLQDIIKKHNLSVDSNKLKSDIKKIKPRKSKRNKIYHNPPPRYVKFNPNNTDSLTWIAMGVKPWTVKSINKYLAKGGQFYDCESLKKIYNLDSSIVVNILPYCDIPPIPRKAKKKWPKKDWKRKDWDSKTKTAIPSWKKSDSSRTHQFQKRNFVIDINEADSTDFKKLYGIGSVLSKRIVRDREALGGFHSIDQLTTVFGVEQEVIDNNKEHLSLVKPYRYININADKKTLASHRLIGWTEAKIISKYTERNGHITNLATTEKIHGISKEFWIKLKPYLDLE